MGDNGTTKLDASCIVRNEKGQIIKRPPEEYLATKRKPRAETDKLRQLKNDLFALGPNALSELQVLLNSKQERVRLDAIKVILQHLLPQQVFSASWKYILKENAGGQSDLANVLPDFAAFLKEKWQPPKEEKESKDEYIDV